MKPGAILVPVTVALLLVTFSGICSYFSQLYTSIEETSLVVVVSSPFADFAMKFLARDLVELGLRVLNIVFVILVSTVTAFLSTSRAGV